MPLTPKPSDPLNSASVLSWKDYLFFKSPFDLASANHLRVRIQTSGSMLAAGGCKLKKPDNPV